MADQERQIHVKHLNHALDLARKSPPKPSNFCVGAILVNPLNDEVLSTGYTLELPGNTHAEQCCLTKLASERGVDEEQLGDVIPEGAVLYTTMEPCFLRLSGNLPCVQRILKTKSETKLSITTVVCGVREPETFVGENQGRKALEDAGITVLYVTGLEEEILKVATAGHVKDGV
jgi:pyrimidine deaminase RibD-like protein